MLPSRYNSSLVAERPPSSIARGTRVLTVELPTNTLAISRGAIEIRENLTYGQTITNYTVEYCPTAAAAAAAAAGFAPSGHSAGAAAAAAACAEGGWHVLPLHNEGQLTIGNRRIHYWTSLPQAAVLPPIVTAPPLRTSGDAVPAADEAGSGGDGGGGGLIRVSVATLKLTSGAETVPYLRSVRVFDWSSTSLDPLLVNILQVR